MYNANQIWLNGLRMVDWGPLLTCLLVYLFVCLFHLLLLFFFFFAKAEENFRLSSQCPRAVTSSTGSKGNAQMLNPWTLGQPVSLHQQQPPLLRHTLLSSSFVCCHEWAVGEAAGKRNWCLRALMVAMSLDRMYSKCRLFVEGLRVLVLIATY